MSVLEVRDLSVEFLVREGRIRPADRISWSVDAGRTLVVLGESGSGKSISVQAVAGILPPMGEIVGGSVLLDGIDLLADPKAQRRARGTKVAMVFQDPLTSLNPGFTVGQQIVEMFRQHSNLSRKEARRRAIELLGRVQIPDPQDRVDRYPHELSGGMRQRVMIALAISQQPAVLVADEPTTALDTTVQAQLIDTLQELQRESGMALVLITHDIGVASAMADDVVVMYAGRVVESGPAVDVLRTPRHPYTEALLSSVPHLAGRDEPLDPIPGSPPELAALPEGCPFHPRCAYAQDACLDRVPPLREVDGHLTACDFSEQIYQASLR